MVKHIGITEKAIKRRREIGRKGGMGEDTGNIG
jgi:hypothetical protein